MSKMSQLYMELSEQAVALGYEDLDDAMANGYVANYTTGELINKTEYSDVEHTKAHEEYLKRKEEVLKDLNSLLDYMRHWDLKEGVPIIKETIQLIKEGEI